MRKLFLVIVLLFLLIACNDETVGNTFLSTEEGKYNLVMVLDGLESQNNDKATEIVRTTNYDNTAQVFIYYSKSHSELENENISDEELPIYLVFDTEELILKTNSSDEVINFFNLNN